MRIVVIVALALALALAQATDVIRPEYENGRTATLPKTEHLLGIGSGILVLGLYLVVGQHEPTLPRYASYVF